jgi:transposase-like protein
MLHCQRDLCVDETMLKIDGQDYWLWIAYESNLNICLMMYQEKGQFCLLSILETAEK